MKRSVALVNEKSSETESFHNKLGGSTMNELTLFNTLFDNALANAMPDFDFSVSTQAPRVDVKQTKDAYTLEMDLPGRTEKDVNIELDHNVLTISSHKEESAEKCEPEKDAKADGKNESRWLIRERRCSSFSRRFTLPEDVDGANVAANFKNGVLFVTMPRKELAAPKRIAITAA